MNTAELISGMAYASRELLGMPKSQPLNMATPHGQRAKENAAILAHEANRYYCIAIADNSQPSWPEAPEWQRISALSGVQQIIDNPNTTSEQSHENWLKDKIADGWVYGEVKDPEKKTHHCIVPYADLPPAQRMKDAIFGAVVREALASYGRRQLDSCPDEISLKDDNLQYSVDPARAISMLATIDRAGKISQRTVLALLAATGYPSVGTAPGREWMLWVQRALLAHTPEQAYQAWQTSRFPLILPDFPSIHPPGALPDSWRLSTTRVLMQWHLLFGITKAVAWIEGIDISVSTFADSHGHAWVYSTLLGGPAAAKP